MQLYLLTYSSNVYKGVVNYNGKVKIVKIRQSATKLPRDR